MKYCEKCHRILKDSEACICGNDKPGDLKPHSSVRVTSVKGSLRAIVEPALKDKGIPCEFFNPEMDVYTQYNPKINAETEYSLLVPFEFYSEAFEVCVGLGLAEPEDKAEVEESTQISSDDKTYDQRFEEASGVKRKSFQILWIILIIVAACLVIWGVDLVAALVKSRIYDIPFTNFY